MAGTYPTRTLDDALQSASIALMSAGSPYPTPVTTEVNTEVLRTLVYYAEKAKALPRPKGSAELPELYFWGACTVEDDWDTGRSRHIIRHGGIDTACGASGSHPDVWAQGHAKPKCPRCLEALASGKIA